jgi:glucose-1-phosphate cytidylyltransferase
MITIGGWPILRHIMQIYASHGITDFIVCLGYKGYVIKEYFANYLLHSADVVEFDLGQRVTNLRHSEVSPWHVTLVETGELTQTGGRIKRVQPWLRDEEAFCLTYGDGVSDVDVAASIAFHRRHGKLATVTAVSPPGRFGTLRVDQGLVTEFVEKPVTDGQPINGGFFVLSPKVFDYIAGDDTVWEHEPLQRLAAEGQLAAFHHAGFWQPMDTVRDRELLEQRWASGNAPWWKGPR